MRKLTEKEFLEKVSDRVHVLSNYSGYRSPISVKCLFCDHTWETKAGVLCRGYGCPQCGLKKARDTKKWYITQEMFLEKIPKKFLDTIEVLSTYENQHCDIKVKCKKCDRIWVSTPYYLYREYGCYNCSRKLKGLKSRKSHEKFVNEVKLFHLDSIKVIGNYTINTNRIEVLCMICDHKWSPVAQRLLRRGCPVCSTPKGEKTIASYLKELDMEYISQFTFEDLKSDFDVKLRFDFAVMKNNNIYCLIEYDGIQHFKPIEYMGGLKRFERQKINDEIKNKYCFEKKLKLIRIPYYELKKLSKDKLKILIKN